MTMVAENSPRKHLDVRGADVSTVITHQVTPEHAEEFLEWQGSITEAAEQFPGYRSTEVYPPMDGGQQWVTIVRFENQQLLDEWMNSPVRAEWTAKLKDMVGNYQMKTLSEGFGGWFARELGQSKAAPPTAWKMALTVLLGLYPTVMLLTVFVTPYTSRFGLAVSVLVGNAISVCILQWAVMPTLNRMLGPWLSTPREKGMALTMAGLFVIVTSLAVLTWAFHRFVG